MNVSSSSGSSGAATTLDPEQLNDRQLFEYCQKVGSVVLTARRKFIGVLPLVERRRTYEGHGFYSVYDFAAMVGGIGREVVTEVMRVNSYLADTPRLRKKLYKGEIGWTKIRTIMHLLTKENENEWIQKLETLSRAALEVYIRDYTKQISDERVPRLIEIDSNLNQGRAMERDDDRKSIDSGNNSWQNNNSLEKYAENKAEFLPGKELEQINKNYIRQDYNPISGSKFEDLATHRETITFSLGGDIAARLRLFRQQMEKDRHELITWEEVMVEFLKKIDQPKVTTSPQSVAGSSRQLPTPDLSRPATRHIPNAIKREVLAKYDGLCAFRDCSKPAEILHHTRRFALTLEGVKGVEDGSPAGETTTPRGLTTATAAEVHDSSFIKPLCKAHERVIHATLVANEDIDPTTWKLLATPDSASPRGQIDQIVTKYRKPK